MDIFKKLFAGGIVRTDEMGEAWDVVFRAQKLSPALNASTTIDEMRERLSEIIDKPIDKSTTVFVPFHQTLGTTLRSARMFSLITRAASWILVES
ncbi:MAG TPA: hypothetical protein VG737_08665 [Cyclobacteriaceae bacterium]|nr:hypothetical protein [Cyclobacteriaceae bacterium]